MSDLKFLDELATSFENLPGVGKKTAQRYALSVVENMTEEEVEKFSKALIDTKTKVHHCKTCGMLCLNDECEICTSTTKDRSKIMVVKDSRDILTIDKMGIYDGLYHSLNGLISLMDGIGPDDINVDSLEKRIDENVKEIILAMPFTPNGEATAAFLERFLKRDNLVISRLGYGLPAGGNIEFIDELTLKRAYERRSNN